jgi:excisionase family DNA binding protein
LQSEERSDRLTYTVEEAGRKLGVGRAAAYAPATRGEIPTIRIGRLIRVPKFAFDRLLENGR